MSKSCFFANLLFLQIKQKELRDEQQEHDDEEEVNNHNNKFFWSYLTLKTSLHPIDIVSTDSGILNLMIWAVMG